MKIISKENKRLFAFLLAFIMCFTMMPAMPTGLSGQPVHATATSPEPVALSAANMAPNLGFMNMWERILQSLDTAPNAAPLDIAPGVMPLDAIPPVALSLNIATTPPALAFGIDFGTLPEGYYLWEITPQRVTIENLNPSDGTGQLVITVSGGGFSVVQIPEYPFGPPLSQGVETITSIPIGESFSFYVRPELGLALGSHNAELVISADVGFGLLPQITHDLEFYVEPARFGLVAVLLLPSIHDIIGTPPNELVNFGNATIGYAPVTAQGITLRNLGNRPTGPIVLQFDNLIGPIVPAPFVLYPSPVVFPMNGGLAPYEQEGYSVTFSVGPTHGLNALGERRQRLYINTPGNILISHPSIDVLFTLGGEPIITTATLPPGVVGSAYSATLAADGLVPGAPADWSVVYGDLPLGLSLASATGAITGTPAQAGTFTFTVRVSNAFGHGERELSITITAQMPAISMTPTNVDFGTVPIGYSVAQHTPVRNIVITNSGNAPTGTLNIGVSNENFVLVPPVANIPSIAAGATANFGVQPAANLPMGIHEATITVGNAYVSPASIMVRLQVSEFIPVIDIRNVPTTAFVGVPLTLTGTIFPATAATNRTIEWAVASDIAEPIDTADARIVGNVFYAARPGITTVIATVRGGGPLNAQGQPTDFTQNFVITVNSQECDEGNLSALITEAEARIQANYTPASWMRFNMELRQARIVRDSPNATQIQTDAAVARLQAAMGNLVNATVAGPNRDTLNAAISEAETRIQAIFTPTGFMRVTMELPQARTVRDNVNATQAQIDAATSRLQTALDRLVMRP